MFDDYFPVECLRVSKKDRRELSAKYGLISIDYNQGDGVLILGFCNESLWFLGGRAGPGVWCHRGIPLIYSWADQTTMQSMGGEIRVVRKWTPSPHLSLQQEVVDDADA
jgi:hypothetical protein